MSARANCIVIIMLGINGYYVIDDNCLMHGKRIVWRCWFSKHPWHSKCLLWVQRRKWIFNAIANNRHFIDYSTRIIKHFMCVFVSQAMVDSRCNNARRLQSRIKYTCSHQLVNINPEFDQHKITKRIPWSFEYICSCNEFRSLWEFYV